MDSAAVILTGGTAVRLDGADKASIEYAGKTFLEHALAATTDAGEVVVVGGQVPTSRPATFVREDPPLGGPVAGLLAGRRALASSPGWLWVQAVDMPRVTRGTWRRLAGAASGAERDGAALCDADGRRQLVLVLRTAALDAATPPDPHGFPMHRLLGELDLVDVPAVDEEARGVDTWRDLARLCDT